MNFALVPVKALAWSKSRLSQCLPPEARHALSRAMLADVLSSVCHASLIDRVAVVSSDATLLELARQLGAMAVDEEYPRGLNGAVAVGTDFCSRQGATSVLILLADLPLVTPADIDLLFQRMQEPSQVILVPCKEGQGTNALLRVPPLVIPTRFGGPSLEAHQRVAHQQSVPCQVIEVPRIAFDLDLVEDLKWLASQTTTTQTSRLLQEIKVCAGIMPKA